MKRWCLILALLGTTLVHSLGSPVDSAGPIGPSPWRQKMSKKWNEPHSALRATVYGALLPGMGQVYNKKYWKLPLVYGALGTCVYFIADNTKNYRHYKEQYIWASDTSAQTVSAYSASQLEPVMETYHRWMDLSYFCLVGVYALQIIDANVDAHLFKYDISPDLSLQWQPVISPLFHSQNRMQGVSIQLLF